MPSSMLLCPLQNHTSPKSTLASDMSAAPAVVAVICWCWSCRRCREWTCQMHLLVRSGRATTATRCKMSPNGKYYSVPRGPAQEFGTLHVHCDCNATDHVHGRSALVRVNEHFPRTVAARYALKFCTLVGLCIACPRVRARVRKA